jgi:hypothetical protein
LAVDFDPFIRNDDAELDSRNFSARAEYRDGRVRLYICVARIGRPLANGDSANADGPVADAGTYTGTVTIIDPRVARTDVPFTFTLAYPYWPRVLLIALVTLVVALCWTWVLERPSDSADSVFTGGFRAWLRSGAGVASVGVATVAGIGALIAIYFKSATWALDVAGVVALITGMFGAFVTGATVQRVAKKSKEGTTEEQQETTPVGR